MNIILLGAPGAGKGTQAELISKHFGIPTISTGAMIRSAIREGTEFGKKAEQFTSTGALVPDDVMIGLVRERLSADDCKNGFILDGFPRTVVQADALTEFNIKIDSALCFEAKDEVIIKRLSGRRECSACATPYHIYNNPSKAGDKCEKCGGDLITRPDDKEETVKNRLKVYYEQSAPLKEYYSKKNVLHMIDAEQSMDKITAEAIRILEKV